MSKLKELLKIIGFSPKENSSDIYIKKYQDNYSIEVDFKEEKINYGNKISSNSKTTQNFSQPENWVVLECVNRLLEKGYKPENIILEKTYPAGHGHSGRLDICVNRDNEDNEYLLIECKTYGKEFENEFNRLKKDGGQLFTYFNLGGNKADLLMLYTSQLSGNKIEYKNEIVKIEEDYRTGDVKDFYEKWSKFTKDNGVFDSWVNPYNFVSKALTLEHLKPIEQEDSSFIFNRFLEILRHNVVSDKPNAFNKIFTLFLCKVCDEQSKKTNEQLDFQWLEGQDDDVSFQIKLTELYKKGMKDFLNKTVSDFSKEDFEKEYAALNEDIKKQLLERIYKLRLEKNNEFAFKEVFDNQSFKENAKIVKEVVELLQGYKLRYNKRQQYLSDFFELLLTTGLKQESGQFFTPVPISQFIIKSLPLDKIVGEKLNSRDNDNLLPYIIDYAAGSGHFLTESMHEIQRLIDAKNSKEYIEQTAKEIDNWKKNHFKWATDYVYGVEKDYRLVKVGKVGCYLHGDGLANVILSDGLAKFDNKEYKGKLKITDAKFPKENKQFDIVISNPPYSVSAFKNASREYYGENEFELYNALSDFSSEIEVLFVERTQQLLKDGGVAGIILPSSILSNAGSYSKAREIILKYFDIIAITELGSNTFMATGTNTVVLFLRRKDNYTSINLKSSVDKFFDILQDVTLLGIEKPISKYINHIWENITLEDYISLIKKDPNENIVNNEIFNDYKNKIKFKNETELFNKIIEIEKEKIFYFILAYNQKVVIVKSGSKDEEKRFLGYEFSSRRGSEGIHPIQRGKSISECTKLFDEDSFTNPEKASTYIYNAFLNNFDIEINQSLENNISRHNLIDMLEFNNVEFYKIISTNSKKKVKFESKWDLVKIADILASLESGKRPKGGVSEYQEGIPSLGGEHINLNGTVSLENMKFVPASYYKNSKQGILNDLDILICKDGALTGKTSLFKYDNFPYTQGMINEHVFLLRANEKVKQKYLFNILYSIKGQELLKLNVTGTAQGGLNRENLLNIQIPLPPVKIQDQIISEIEVLEKREEEINEKIENSKNVIFDIFNKSKKIGSSKKLSEIFTLEYGISLPEKNRKSGVYPVVGSNGISGYHDEYYLKGPSIIIGRKGSAGKINLYNEDITPIDTTFFVKLINSDNLKFIYYLLKTLNLEFLAQGVGVPGINRNVIYKLITNIPPIEEQEKIVKEIEKIELEIKKLENELKGIPSQKEDILKKYL